MKSITPTKYNLPKLTKEVTKLDSIPERDF